MLPVSLLPYVISKYHIFSLAAMKHVVTSALPWKEKRKKLREIYKDELLRKTIERDVLQKEPLAIAMFMRMIKARAYCLCDLLLMMKA